MWALLGGVRVSAAFEVGGTFLCEGSGAFLGVLGGHEYLLDRLFQPETVIEG